MADDDHKLTDTEQAYYEDILGRGAGDPDHWGLPNNVPSVYKHKPYVRHAVEPDMHWTERLELMESLPKDSVVRPARDWGDNNAGDPEQADWNKP